jgi:hypothetical protein
LVENLRREGDPCFKGIMIKRIKVGIILCGVLVIGFLSTYLPRWTDRLFLGGLGILVFVAVVMVVSEWLRRVVEGYYVYMSGGAEDGDLIYNEAGKILRLYFKRKDRIIYVPSNAKWQEVMPQWAKEKRNFITDRIRKQIGRHWVFEETEKPEYVMSQI